MRFIFKGAEKELSWDEDRHLGKFLIEEPKTFRKVVSELSDESEEKSFAIFSEKEKKLSFKNEIDTVFNPMRLEFNSRRTMTILMKILVQTSLSEEFYLSTNRFKTNIVKYLSKIVDANDFGFEVDAEEFDVGQIAKGIGLKIMDDEDDFVEQLTDYMEMMTELVGIKLFIFVGLTEFLSESETKRLEKNIKNHQVNLLLIERRENGIFEKVPKIIIDKDLCEI